MNLQPPPGGERIVGDVALEAPPGGEAIVGGSGIESHPDYQRFLDLASRIFFPASTLPDLAKGALSGIQRKPASPDATIDENAGNIIGRNAPSVAGAIGGGLAGAALTGGMGAIPAALAVSAMVGGGAAAGELAGAGIAKAAGGEAPDTLGDAAKQAGEVGITAAMTDLGFGAMAKAVELGAPKLVSMFRSFPKEGLKRTFQRPEEVLGILEGAKNGQLAAETEGVKALREVQNGLTIARAEAGKRVERELEDFFKVTKGQKLIDANGVAAAGAEALSNRMTEDGVTSLNAGDARVLLGKNGLIEELQNAGPLSAKDAVVWRKRLDNLIDYGRGKVPEITSGEGQAIIGKMAAALRQQIQDAAVRSGAYNLAEANANFSNIAKAYDAYRPAFNTKTALGSEAVRRLNVIERMFNQGGLSQADLTEIGKHFPALQKPVDRLLDAVVARKLAADSAGSPSGVMMSAIRELAGPQGMLTGVRASRYGNAIKRGATAAATATTGELSRK